MVKTIHWLSGLVLGAALLSMAACGGSETTGSGASSSSSSSTGGHGGNSTGTSTTSTGGAGGSGGAACDPAACPPASNECVVAVCSDAGACAEEPRPDGTPAATQKAGDCKQSVCKGGAVSAQNDSADIEDDANECTEDSCDAGMPVHAPKPLSTPCGARGALFCDGAGKCVECDGSKTCPGVSDECQSPTCEAGACGTSFAPQGTPSMSQTMGDCKKMQCNGQGTLEAVADATDPEDDGNPCTDDSCAADMPVHTPTPVQTACGAGLKCDGAGNCVGCIDVSDCQVPGNPCLVATCVAGMCGTTNKADGTACNDGNACSQTDTCQAGACTGNNPVVCAASDPCHAAGACDPATGVCSNPSKADGTACNDGNACTQTDTCQAGTCTGQNPVVCGAPDQCHGPGACNPLNGVCSFPNKANGTACNDGNGCTQTDTCQAGTCTGQNPVVCAASDQCHNAGVCNAATGVCSNPNKADGTACNDGNGCTQTDTCQAGTCTGQNPVVCAAPDQCHNAGLCNVATGLCSAATNKPNGTACNDGNGCTQTDTCQAGLCAGANPVSCAALDQCHVAGVCAPATGMCSNPSKADGSACVLGGQAGTCGNGACSICGNGIMEGNEQCDDSNVTPCDGCSPKCQLDTSITYATAAGLNAAVTDDAYNGTQASMTCVNINVTNAGDNVVDFVCPTLGMTHTWIGDLTIKLFSPAGTAITLMSMPGVVEAADNGQSVTGDSSNLLATFPITWKDGGPKSAELMGNTLANAGVVCKDDAACVYDPNNGAAAAGKLVNFVGQAGPGVWKLCVGDSGVGDLGSIDQVKLIIGQ